MNIQFYRQKPIGNYIVDFYAPLGKLVIEVDGEQHLEKDQMQKDEERDLFMKNKDCKYCALIIYKYYNALMKSWRLY